MDPLMVHGRAWALACLLCAALRALGAPGSGAVTPSFVSPPARRPARLLWPACAGARLRLRGGCADAWASGAPGSDSGSEDQDFPTLADAAAAAVARESAAGDARGLRDSEEEPPAGGGESDDQSSCGGSDHEDSDGAVDRLWDVTQGEGAGLWRYGGRGASSVWRASRPRRALCPRSD